MTDLKGKVAVVTGAGRGIGREIALAMARAGANVVVADITDQIFDVAKQVEALNVQALPVKWDVSYFEQSQEVKNKIYEKFQKVDVLVNNAGIYPQKAFLEMTEADWRKVLHINLDGVFNCTKALLPGMVAQKSGRIINIASIAGAVVAYPLLAHYSASKAGIMGFTRSLALEVAGQGVNVNAIAPGAIDVFEGQMDEAMTSQIIKAIPSGRMGKPLDVANLAVFLAGDESSYITGQTIVCDGGYTLP